VVVNVETVSNAALMAYRKIMKEKFPYICQVHNK